MGNVFNRDARENEGRQRVSPARRLLDEILDRWGLDRPDRRPIYRYRISHEEFSRGREILQKYGSLLDPGNQLLCAVFALVTAEWYRREATSLWRVWSHIGVVPDDLAVNERNDIADAGLRWWGQSPKISQQSNRKRREFLLTLAINGGLPSALIVGETGNRVRRFFEGVMEDTLASGAMPDVVDLIRFAENRSDALPESYRDETIYELTAELIGELVACRTKLPRDERQANPAGWLDVHDPDWRERLPIHLPDEASACNRLFNNLLTIEPRARGSAIGLRRQLSRTPSGDWQQGFVVQADGQLAFDALAGYSEGRFRAYFSGGAGHLMSREFAQLYRSETEKNGAFNVTARSIGRPGFIGPVPFTETVGVTLLRDGQSLPAVCWPGGGARVSSCFVLKATDRDDRLELIGTGSVRSALPILFVLTPTGTSVIGHQEGAVECIWQDARTTLWRIEGMALVETQTGDRYRVHAGSEETDERRLEFDLRFLPDLTFDDTSILAVEAPLRPRSVGVPTGSAAPQAFLRILKAGRQISNRETATGVVTVQWQDEEGFLIDRARLLVLPDGFTLTGQIEQLGARIKWRSLAGWRIEAVDTDNIAIAVLEADGDSFLCPWSGAPMGQQHLKLTDPDGTSIAVRLRLTASRTILVDADGKIRNDRPDLSLSDLRGAFLLSERPALIDLDLRGAGEVRALISRKVEGETPMVRFGDLAHNLLGLSHERGPSVLVQDEHQRTLCTIRRSQEQPAIEADSIRFKSPAAADEITVARPLLAPDEEYLLPPDQANLFVLPPQISGPCLVYRRKGDAVTTRPTLASRPVDPACMVEMDAIGRVALVDDETGRRAAYNKLLTDVADDPAAGAQISRIVRLVHSLRGLSPRALDLTRELPNCPALLCRLLLAANAERIEAILGLERDLPFLWMALPVPAWQEAARTEWERVKIELIPILGTDEAQKQATAMMTNRIDALASRTDWFSGIRWAMGFGSALMGDLRHLAQDHVRLHADQPGPVATVLIKEAQPLGLPPAIASLNFHHYATLVAPVVLAGLALGRLTLTSALAAGLRNALDIDQSYISSAFPHCLKQLKSS